MPKKKSPVTGVTCEGCKGTGTSDGPMGGGLYSCLLCLGTGVKQGPEPKGPEDLYSLNPESQKAFEAGKAFGKSFLEKNPAGKTACNPDAGVRFNTYAIISRAVEEACRYGWMRAHKHVENPDEQQVCEAMESAIMGALCEIMHFREEGENW